MEGLIYFNSVVNIFLLGWWFYKNNRLYFSPTRSSYGNIILGINMMWRNQSVYSGRGCSAKGLFYIPIRNSKKIETNEKVRDLINKSYQGRRQVLHATFSWLKTTEEVEQFQKDYLIVDEKLVTQLVRDFKTNKA